MSTTTTAAELSRVRKGRLLTAAEQEKSLTWLGRGLNQRETLKKLRVSNATWSNTLEAEPGFRSACEVIYASRIRDVEVTAYQIALGGVKTVKLVYEAHLDKAGNPVKDEATGRPKMILRKREVVVHPPHWEAVKFLLASRMPETYSSKALAHEHQVESLDLIRAMLEGKVKEMEAKSQPITVNVESATVSVPPPAPQQIGPQ